MSTERSLVMARWMPSDHVLTYGVRIFGFNASVLQGAGSVTGVAEPAGVKVRPSPHWSAKTLAGKMLPHAADPPVTQAEVCACQPAESPAAPVTFSVSTFMLPCPALT